MKNLVQKEQILNEVIFKVKHWQDLTPEEEMIYLECIEGFTEEEAREKVKSWYSKGDWLTGENDSSIA